MLSSLFGLFRRRRHGHGHHDEDYFRPPCDFPVDCLTIVVSFLSDTSSFLNLRVTCRAFRHLLDTAPDSVCYLFQPLQFRIDFTRRRLPRPFLIPYLRVIGTLEIRSSGSTKRDRSLRKLCPHFENLVSLSLSDVVISGSSFLDRFGESPLTFLSVDREGLLSSVARSLRPLRRRRELPRFTKTLQKLVVDFSHTRFLRPPRRTRQRGGDNADGAILQYLQLRSLHIIRVRSQFTNQHFIMELDAMNRLETLVVHESVHLSDVFFEFLSGSGSLPRLRKIELFNVDEVTAPALRLICSSKTLEEVTVKDCDKITSRSQLENLLEDLPDLHIVFEPPEPPERMVMGLIRRTPFTIEWDQLSVVRELDRDDENGSVISEARWEYDETSAHQYAQVCLRVLKMSPGTEVFDRIEIEAAMLSSISHPHFERHYGLALNVALETRIGVISEFASPDLGKYIRRSVENEEFLPVEEKIRLLAELASALVYMQERALVTNSLRPSKILLDEHMTVKLSCWNLFYDKTKPQRNQQRVGTVEWWCYPPEALFTIKSSVYSFGMVAFMLLFNAIDPSEICSSERVDETSRPTIPPSEEHECPEQLVDLMRRCWSSDEPSRPTAKAIVEELRLMQ